MDYFDTEEFEETPEFTDIELPGSGSATKKEDTPTKPRDFASPAPRKLAKVYVPHKQNAEFLRNLAPAANLINLAALDSYVIPMHSA